MLKRLSLLSSRRKVGGAVLCSPGAPRPSSSLFHSSTHTKTVLRCRRWSCVRINGFATTTASAVVARTLTWQGRFHSDVYQSSIPCTWWDMDTSKLSGATHQETLPPRANVYVVELRLYHTGGNHVDAKSQLAQLVQTHKEAVAKEASSGDAAASSDKVPLLFVVLTDDSSTDANEQQEALDEQLRSLGVFGECRVCVLNAALSSQLDLYTDGLGSEAVATSAQADVPESEAGEEEEWEEVEEEEVVGTVAPTLTAAGEAETIAVDRQSDGASTDRLPLSAAAAATATGNPEKNDFDLDEMAAAIEKELLEAAATEAKMKAVVDEQTRTESSANTLASGEKTSEETEEVADKMDSNAVPVVSATEIEGDATSVGDSCPLDAAQKASTTSAAPSPAEKREQGEEASVAVTPAPKPVMPMPVYTKVPAALYEGASTVHLSDRAHRLLPDTANVLLIDHTDWLDDDLAVIDTALALVDPVVGHVLFCRAAYEPTTSTSNESTSKSDTSILPFIFVFRTSLSHDEAARVQHRFTDALRFRPGKTSSSERDTQERILVCVLSAAETYQGGENPLEALRPPAVEEKASDAGSMSLVDAGYAWSLLDGPERQTTLTTAATDSERHLPSTATTTMSGGDVSSPSTEESVQANAAAAPSSSVDAETKDAGDAPNSDGALSPSSDALSTTAAAQQEHMASVMDTPDADVPATKGIRSFLSRYIDRHNANSSAKGSKGDVGETPQVLGAAVLTAAARHPLLGMLNFQLAQFGKQEAPLSNDQVETFAQKADRRTDTSPEDKVKEDASDALPAEAATSAAAEDEGETKEERKEFGVPPTEAEKNAAPGQTSAPTPAAAATTETATDWATGTDKHAEMGKTVLQAITRVTAAHTKVVASRAQAKTQLTKKPAASKAASSRPAASRSTPKEVKKNPSSHAPHKPAATSASKAAAKAVAKPSPTKAAAKPVTKPSATKAAAKPVTKPSPTKAAAKPVTKPSPTKAAAKPVTKPSPTKAAAKPVTKPSPTKAAAKPVTKPSPTKAAAKPVAKASSHTSHSRPSAKQPDRKKMYSYGRPNDAKRKASHHSANGMMKAYIGNLWSDAPKSKGKALAAAAAAKAKHAKHTRVPTKPAAKSAKKGGR